MHFSPKHFLAFFNEAFTFFFVFPGMIFLGIYLTYKLNAVQIFKLKEGFQHLFKRKIDCEGNISHFEAISTVLAGNFGTGNISGIAIAFSTGGPGALVWMWIMVFFGSIIQYASCCLGVKYRSQNKDGEFVGGPMYYLSKGLGFYKLAALFSCLTIFASFSAGILPQMNSMSLPAAQYGLHPLYFGILMALCVGLITLGGIQRLGRFASMIVPLKAFLYLGTGLLILALNYDQVLPAMGVMLRGSWDATAFTGGILGGGIAQIISTGFDRGLFATDAGTGIVPILQSSARTQHPVVDGLVTLVAPVMVMIVCTMTGLILIISGVWTTPYLQSTNMVTHAFKIGLGHEIGEYIVIFALILFGFTTLLTWAHCGEKAADYIAGKRGAKLYKYAYVLLVPVGGLMNVDMVWTLADLTLTSMLVMNMVGIGWLVEEVVSDTRSYYYPELALDPSES